MKITNVLLGVGIGLILIVTISCNDDEVQPRISNNNDIYHVWSLDSIHVYGGITYNTQPHQWWDIQINQTCITTNSSMCYPSIVNQDTLFSVNFIINPTVYTIDTVNSERMILRKYPYNSLEFWYFSR